MKYIVEVKEVHTQPYLVEAKSEEDAKKKVRETDDDCEILESGFEYSYTLDDHKWKVYPVAGSSWEEEIEKMLTEEE
jgi:hypothetical protein